MNILGKDGSKTAVSKMRMPCGWEIEGNNAYAEPLEFEENRLEQPPPAQPSTDKPVGRAKRVLD